MNKLFLLLILSFFSAQSIAGSCPDGSEPVKSVSADGTYFVYNCDGSNTANSSASSQKVVKALAGIDIENDPNIDFFKPPREPIQPICCIGGVGNGKSQITTMMDLVISSTWASRSLTI